MNVRQWARDQLVQHHSKGVHVWVIGVGIGILHANHLWSLQRNKQTIRNIQYWANQVLHNVSSFHSLSSSRFSDRSQVLTVRSEQWGPGNKPKSGWEFRPSFQALPSRVWSQTVAHTYGSHSTATLSLPDQSHRLWQSSPLEERCLDEALRKLTGLKCDLTKLLIPSQ